MDIQPQSASNLFENLKRGRVDPAFYKTKKIDANTNKLRKLLLRQPPFPADRSQAVSELASEGLWH
jgi:hypothetical protein